MYAKVEGFICNFLEGDSFIGGKYLPRPEVAQNGSKCLRVAVDEVGATLSLGGKGHFACFLVHFDL